MYEFWLPDKALFMIGLFPFGLILIMYAIFYVIKLNVSHENPNPSESVKNAPNNIANEEISSESNLPDRGDQPLMTQLLFTEDMKTEQPNFSEIYLNCKVDIAPELLTELMEISDDPAATVDEAIRWWLRRRNLILLDSSTNRRDRVGVNSYGSQRSQKELWND